MDKYGFIIYEGAWNYSLSTSYEIVKENLKIGWLSDYISTPLKDIFYLFSFNSYNDLNKYISTNKKEKIYNIVKTNKIIFLKIQQKMGTSNKFNKIYNNYGIIGLKYNSNSYYNAPEFINSLKEIKEIKTYSFSLKFENIYMNNFVDNNNKGYFIIGEELTDDINEKEEIRYSYCEINGGSIDWNIKFDKIYVNYNDTLINKNKINNNLLEYKEEKKKAEFFVNYPYLIGSTEYFQYIKENFFNELVEQNLCYCSNFINNDKLYSYICDGNSQYFIDYLNNKFPDLVF